MSTSNTTFQYWKKPYAPWVILGTILLNALGLFLDIQDFRTVSQPEISTTIFSQGAWADYVISHQFQCCLSILLIALFLGHLIVGSLARNQKQADVYAAILHALITVFWGAVALVIPVFSQMGRGAMWLVLFLLGLGCAIYGFWKSRNG